jgi:hypothetical protein
LCNIEADLSCFPLSEFEKHVHKLGMFKKSRIFYLVKYHVAASSSPADIIFEVQFKGKSVEHKVERRVLWHDISQPAPGTLTPDVGSLSIRTIVEPKNTKQTEFLNLEPVQRLWSPEHPNINERE